MGRKAPGLTPNEGYGSRAAGRTQHLLKAVCRKAQKIQEVQRLSRRVILHKPATHLSTCIAAFILVSFFVLFAPKTGYAVDVTLAWNGNTSTDLAGYRIYHRQDGQVYDYNYPIWEGTETTCTIYSLDDTTSHYFVARAFDIYSNESSDSAEVSLEVSIDTDGDGTLDSLDGCPNDPNKTEPGICGCGVADTDSDGDGTSDCNEAVNIPPTADAGPDQTVDEGSIVFLDGSNSWDDGTFVSHAWIQIAGIAVTLFDAETSKAYFSAPYLDIEGTSLTFKLTVTDEWGRQSQDTCIVNVASLDTEAQGPLVSVSNVAIEIRKMGTNYRARAHVVIEDEYGAEVKEAGIKGNWTLNDIPLNSIFGSTNGLGEAKLDSDKVNAEPGDTFTLIITDIIKNGYIFDPSNDTYSSPVP